MLRFRGKSAIVTGAGSGIGAAMAAQLRDEGAWVLGADLDPKGAPPGVEQMVVDVSCEADVESMIAAVLAKAGRIDILFNNAGVASTTDVVGCSVEEWDRVFAINVRGVFLGCKYAIPRMLAQGEGVIVNTASVAGKIGFRDRAAYSASKAAVIGLTKQIASQYAGQGIRCNCICPGTVDSPWVARLTDDSGDAAAARRALTERQPLGRLAMPAEIAEAACYLASEASAFITGTELVIDGGILAVARG